MPKREWINVDQREPITVCGRCGAMVIVKYKSAHASMHENIDAQLMHILAKLDHLYDAMDLQPPIPF